MATFIVETGTGIENANSYCSISFAESYIDDYYGEISEWSSISAEQQERALRVATQYIELKYGGRVTSRPKVSTQGLKLPRYYDVELPIQILQATVEAALLSVKGYDLLGVIDEPGMLASEKVKAGEVESEETYINGKSQIPSFPKIEKLIQAVLGSNDKLYR